MDHKSPRDNRLTAEGWVRQFSASEPRLSEAVASYRELGFEVRLEPVELRPPDGSCRSCLIDCPDHVKVIYTRPEGNFS